jgi:5-aminopentanamidase
MRVGIVQANPRLGEVAENLRRSLDWLAQARTADCDLVVFTECALTGYMFGNAADAFGCAETVPGASTTAFANACAGLGVHCVVGMLERDGDRLRNACVLIGPDGIVGRYRKSHIARVGADCFTMPGDEDYTVYATPIGRIGLQICYDWRFPEITRTLALRGAELVAHPTNSPVASRDLADFLPRARAAENAVFFAMANRVGTESDTTFFGRSQLVDPSGRVVVVANDSDETLLVADADLAQAREKTRQPGQGQYAVHLFGDRQPSLYGAIVADRQ